MLLGETIAVALASIRANLLRAALTMLGIVIGVGAVITMVALGTGAQRSIEEQIDALGARKLTIFAGQSRGAVSHQPNGRHSRPTTPWPWPGTPTC